MLVDLFNTILEDLSDNGFDVENLERQFITLYDKDDEDRILGLIEEHILSQIDQSSYFSGDAQLITWAENCNQEEFAKKIIKFMNHPLPEGVEYGEHTEVQRGIC